MLKKVLDTLTVRVGGQLVPRGVEINVYLEDHRHEEFVNFQGIGNVTQNVSICNVTISDINFVEIRVESGKWKECDEMITC